MRKIMLLLLFFLLFISFSRAQYVTLEGRQFKDENGNDFYPVVCNYAVTYLYKDNDTTTLFISPSSECDGWCYDCNSMNSCLDQMQRNFEKIKDMGFNAVRLFGASPLFVKLKNIPPGWRIHAIDYSYSNSHNCSSNSLEYYHDYYMCQPFDENSTVQKIFELIDSVLVRAWKSDIKVILVSGGGCGLYDPELFPDQYKAYLGTLSQHINSVSPIEAKQALMAYDLINEPKMSFDWQSLWPSATVGHSKQDVCYNVRMWYDTIKAMDPSHLVTLGGHGYLDVFEFDPEVMKLDFYSHHIYPVKKSYYPSIDEYEYMLGCIHGHNVWLENNLPMPYIIGETGFKANPLNAEGGPDGTLQQQKDYSEATLDLTRFYSGSGYSWWNYQDYFWSIRDCYLGLLYRNSYNQILEKPIVEAFRQYDPFVPPPVFLQPDSYYDPYHHSDFNTSHLNSLTGHVQDENGNPIKDAVIEGITVVGSGYNASEWHYTFTNSQGDFELIPYDYKPLNEPDGQYVVVNSLHISAPGCSRFITDWYSSFSGGVPSTLVDTVRLNRVHLGFSETVQNRIFTTTESVQAWDKILLQNVAIANTGEFEAKSRREINVKTEFFSMNGSETWLHLGETLLPCEQLSPDFLKQGPIPADPIDNYSDEVLSIDLQFIEREEAFNFTIYPNPGNGLFTIDLNSESISASYPLIVMDTYGRTLFHTILNDKKTNIDLSVLESGVYSFMVYTNELRKVKKGIIVKQ